MKTHSRIHAWRIPMDRGTWWATIHGVTKSLTWLKWLSMHMQILGKSAAAAAASKSHWSCPTLCNPIDSSPPGSSVSGILQARIWSGLPFPPPIGNSRTPWVGQMVENVPAMWETWVWPLGWEDPLEKGMATYSSIIACRIPWTEEPGRLQSMGSQRVGHDWVTNTWISLQPQNCCVMHLTRFSRIYWQIKPKLVSGNNTANQREESYL